MTTNALSETPQRPAEDSSPAGRTIVCELRTTATPEQAWAAWAEPEKIAHWFVDRAHGDVRPGGVMTWVFEQFKLEIPYPILDVQPPERLVFGGEIPGFPPFRLEITIRRDGGDTVVRLFNSGFREGAQWDDEYQGVDSGWRLALGLLGYYLENHFGTPKQTLLIVQPASFSFADVMPWFTNESKLSRWLTKSGSIDSQREGDVVELVLQNGEVIRGKVLAATARELAVSWPDSNAVLEFKAFAMGPTRMIGVRATGWGVSAERMRALEADLNAAVARLAAVVGG